MINIPLIKLAFDRNNTDSGRNAPPWKCSVWKSRIKNLILQP